MRRRNVVAVGLAVVGLAVLVAVTVRASTERDADAAVEAVGERPGAAVTSTTTFPVLGSTSLASPPTEPGPADGPSPAPCDTSGWTLDARLRSLVFASLSGPSTDEVQRVVQAGVGGVFISTASVPVLEGGTLEAIVAASPLRPLVAVDEEGGRVQRLAGLLGDLPSAREMAAAGAPDRVRATARAHGEAMRALGITVDFAPVVDVTDDTEGVIGDRSFSADPAIVAEMAGAFAAGLADGGVLPTFKHFPGHGHADGDSHERLVTTPPLDDLEADLAPYRQLLPDHPGALVMVGHLDVPGLTDGLPASISAPAIELLRDELDFDGIVVTDDFGAMGGILDLFPTVEASVRAIQAGMDMVLVPSVSTVEVVAALTDAVRAGTLPEDQVTRSSDRILAARAAGACTRAAG